MPWPQAPGVQRLALRPGTRREQAFGRWEWRCRAYPRPQGVPERCEHLEGGAASVGEAGGLGKHVPGEGLNLDPVFSKRRFGSPLAFALARFIGAAPMH